MGLITPPIIYDDALVTSLVKYGDKDCIVRLFMRDQGRFNGFFKRGLAITKTKTSVVQAPGFARVGYIKNKIDAQLLKIKSCDMDPLFVLPVSLRQMGYCFYIAELIEKFIPEGEVDGQVFELSKQAFSLIYENGAQPSLLRAFEIKLLHVCGFLAQLPKSELNINYYYDPDLCVFKDINYNKNNILITPEALNFAHSFLTLPMGTIECENNNILLVLGKVFQSYLRVLFKKPLNSVLFLKNIRI